MVGRYRGRVDEWDVVNEAIADDGQLRDTIWLRKIGPDYIELAFRWAREADPNARLYYNDYGAEGSGQKADAVYNLLADLRQRGVPVDGVGFQSHFTLYVPPGMDETFTRFSGLGLDLAITEMDVRLRLAASATDLQNQADVYQRVLTTCRTQPRCRTFTVWGVIDRYSWVPDYFPGYGAPLLFDDYYLAKPAYYGARRALGEQPGKTSVVDAEASETRTNGEASGGGWALYSNGYIEHPFEAPGEHANSVTVVAKGKQAGGDWPRMRLRVNGTAASGEEVVVNSEQWRAYRFDVGQLQGTVRLGVEFMNEFYGGPDADRNLYLDQYSLGSVLNAEQMQARSTGSSHDNGWALWSAGYVAHPVDFSRTDRYAITVRARGTYAGGGWPELSVRVDGVELAKVSVTSESWREYQVEVPVTSGRHRLGLFYGNDYVDAQGDRNLFLDTATAGAAVDPSAL